jgi:DNA (cytosine-5)-methyltransferase 1
MRVIELFAGAGGAALGLEAAGLEHAALVERDPDACAVMRAAGLAPVVEADVRDLDIIERVAGALCDLLWSSWPCQPWSHAGSRKGEHDDRNGWPWTLDAIDRFRPSWFIGENVRGLLSSSYFVDVILPDLKRRYRHVGHWLLDAADYGVPQHRIRLFVWANDSRPLVPPTRTHGPGMFTQPWVTMGQALELDGARAIGGGRNPQAAGIERTYRDLTDEPSTCVTAVQIGNAGPWVERPAPTVTTADGQGVGSAHSRDIIERTIGRRRLTPAECATLQGFPDGYPWHACRTKTARYRAIGNAVPPALAQAVASVLP